MKWVVLLTGIVVWALSLPLAAQADGSSPVSTLLDHLKIRPKQADCEQAATLLSGNSLPPNDAAQLEAALRSNIMNAANKGCVLAALAKYSVRQFDLDLALLMPEPTVASIPSDFDALLAAMVISGAGASRSAIASAAGTPSQSFFPVRFKLWQALSTMDEMLATSTALTFYGTTLAGRWEYERDDKAAHRVIDLINKIAKDRDRIIHLFPSFALYIGRDERAFGPGYTMPKLDSGAVDSARYRTLAAIENTLMPISSPAARDLLLRFTQAVDPKLSEPALKADYSSIEQRPWLLPASAFVFGLHDRGSRAEKLLSKLKIGLPRDVTVLDIEKEFSLGAYERTARGKGYAFPNGVPKLSANEAAHREKKFLESLLTAVSKHYGVSMDVINSATHTDLTNQPQSSYISIDRAVSTALDILTRALVMDGTDRKDASSIASEMMGKELENRALVMYALIAATYRSGISASELDLANADYMLSRLSSTIDAPNILKSKVVSDILSSEQNNNTASTPENCTSISATVHSRAYSFDQGLYREEIAAQCADGRQFSFTWMGAIPLPLLVPLRAHPRLLDFSNTSLATREMRAEAAHAEPVMDDIDYVRRRPIRTLAYLAETLASPTTPWRDVKDTLMIDTNFGAPTEFLMETSQSISEREKLPPPPPLPVYPWLKTLPDDAKKLLADGLPGGVRQFIGVVVAANDVDYQTRSHDAYLPFLNLMTYRTGRLAAEQQKAAVDKLPNDNDCNPVDFLCDLDIIRSKNQQKETALENLKQMIADATATEQYLQAWDLSPLKNGRPRSVQLRQMIIKPDWSTYCSTYEFTAATGEVRYATLEGTMPPIPAWLRYALNKNPHFLSQFDIDLGLASTGASDRLVSAVTRVLREDTGTMPAVEMLERVGLYPLTPWAIGADPVPPLFATFEGQTLAAEMTAWQKILKVAVGEHLPDSGPPKEQFLASVIQMWDRAQATVQQKANDSAKPIVDSIEQSQKKPWTVGISLSLGPGVMVGPFFSYGSSAASVNTSFSGNWLVSGQIGGQQLPSFLLTTSTPSSSNMPDMSSNDSQDAMLSSSETRQLVLGTASWMPTDPTPSRVLASVTPPNTSNFSTIGAASITPAELSLPSMTLDNANITIQLPVAWNSIPPLLGPGPWKNSGILDGGRAWLAGLIGQARPKLTDADVAAIHGAVKAGFFPEPLLDILFDRRREALEEEKVAGGEWFHTDVIESLIPATVQKQDRPAYMENQNRQADAGFHAAVSQWQTTMKTKAIFRDGMPAMRITYGNNFEVMGESLDYQLVNGQHITWVRLMETPFWLVEPTRKDPNGHIFEKLSAAAADNMRQWASDPMSSPLRHAELAKFRDSEQEWKDVTQQLGDRANDMVKELQAAIDDYFNKLKTWQVGQPTRPSVEVPFQPNMLGAPMLNFFPAPYEWSLRRDELVSDILTRERANGVGSDVRSGELAITASSLFN